MSDGFRDILKKHWGYDDFRGIQREIIESICSGKDTLGLMPTGGGKSITFQVPALYMEGICLVISPLIALMKDQVEHLRSKGIQAYAIHTGISHDKIIQILDNCILGNVKLLYVSPERLSSRLFLTKMRHMKVSFITIDEAHCISQWGHDFRPSYLGIYKIRGLLPHCPVLALTATATKTVCADIKKQLGFSADSNEFRMSFVRKNIAYILRKADEIELECIHIVNSVPGSAIIYVSSRKKTIEFSRILKDNGINSTYYHAGLDIAVKNRHQSDWQSGKARVIVATNAFGMGIDKPDVRLVVHLDCPSSIEAYFQEAGRAGRDGHHSYAVLLHNRYTKSILKNRISSTFPTKEFVKKVYDYIAFFFQVGEGMGMEHSFIFNIDKFCNVYKFNSILVNSALHILDRAGYIQYKVDDDNRSRVRFIIERDKLYKLTGLSRKEDDILSALLRNYTGMFTDFAYIDEEMIGKLCSLTSEEVYVYLSELRRKGILRFIPPRTEPMITYLMDRVNCDRLVLSETVYDNLLATMNMQINAMIDYIEDDETCRQQKLVSYFGDNEKEPCQHCDVCREKNKNK